MQTNTTKQKLNNGETVYGAFFRTPDNSLIELQGYLGWDFLVLDGEHGTLQPRDVEDQCRACELHGVTPIARATTNEQSIILRFMDTGVQGALHQVPAARPTRPRRHPCCRLRPHRPARRLC